MANNAHDGLEGFLAALAAAPTDAFIIEGREREMLWSYNVPGSNKRWIVWFAMESNQTGHGTQCFNVQKVNATDDDPPRGSVNVRVGFRTPAERDMIKGEPLKRALCYGTRALHIGPRAGQRGIELSRGEPEVDAFFQGMRLLYP